MKDIAFKNMIFDLMLSDIKLAEIAPTIYMIKDSVGLPKKFIEKRIEKLGYKVLFSENRLSGNLVITFSPTPPKSFKKLLCADKNADSETVWKIVTSTSSLRENGKPIIVQGDHFADSPEEAEKIILNNCIAPAPILIDFLEKISTNANVLDLGCGRGANTLPLLFKGCQVTAVDRSATMLHKCIRSVERNKLDKNRLSIIKADIETVNLEGQKFDLIVCTDVLPYINSKKLKSVLERIFNLLNPNGFFVGDFLCKNPENVYSEECMRRLGAHIYPQEDLIPAMLRLCHFNIDECSIRLGYSGREAIQFIASKPKTYEKAPLDVSMCFTDKEEEKS